MRIPTQEPLSWQPHDDQPDLETLRRILDQMDDTELRKLAGPVRELAPPLEVAGAEGGTTGQPDADPERPSA